MIKFETRLIDDNNKRYILGYRAFSLVKNNRKYVSKLIVIEN